MIRCILIDDEISSIEILKYKLEKSCPEIEVINQFQSSNEAYSFLQSNQCDLIFLDIEMPEMTGFDLLRKLGNRLEKVIFITAYDQFAIQAVKCSALDYLLKPIDTQELINAVEKVKKEADKSFQQRLLFLLENFKKKEGDPGKIVVSTSEGIEILPVENILCLEAESNYTIFHFENSKPLIASKTLKYFEEALTNYQFFRSHHKYLVSVSKIKRINKQDGGSLILSNDKEIPISRRRKEYVVQMINEAYGP